MALRRAPPRPGPTLVPPQPHPPRLPAPQIAAPRHTRCRRLMQSFQTRSVPLWKKLLSRSVRYVSGRCAFAPPPVYASFNCFCQHFFEHLCSKTLRDELNVDHVQTATFSIQRAADCHLLAFELLCLF